jgi:hypothetical protein
VRLRVVFAILFAGCVAIVGAYAGRAQSPGGNTSRVIISPLIAFQGSHGIEKGSQSGGSVLVRPGQHHTGQDHIYHDAHINKNQGTVLYSLNFENLYSRTHLEDDATPQPGSTDALDLYPAPSPAPNTQGCWLINDGTITRTRVLAGWVMTDTSQTIFITTKFATCPPGYPPP